MAVKVPVRMPIHPEDPYAIVGEATISHDGLVLTVVIDDSLAGDIAQSRLKHGHLLALSINPDHVGDAAAKRWHNATLTKEN